MKIYLTAIIKAKEEHSAEVLKVLQNMVAETRKEEANELYTLHQGIEDKNQFDIRMNVCITPEKLWTW